LALDFPDQCRLESLQPFQTVQVLFQLHQAINFRRFLCSVRPCWPCRSTSSRWHQNNFHRRPPLHDILAHTLTEAKRVSGRIFGLGMEDTFWRISSKNPERWDEYRHFYVSMRKIRLLRCLSFSGRETIGKGVGDLLFWESISTRFAMRIETGILPEQGL